MWVWALAACASGRIGLLSAEDTAVGVDTADSDDSPPDSASPDDCGGGDNMSDLHLRHDSVASSITIGWSIGTGRGAELPPAYFAAGALSPRTDPQMAANIEELRIFPADGGGGTIIAVGVDSPVPGRLVIDFPDRRDFINCTHPGMDDVWWLQVDVTIGVDVEATFTQGVDLGDI